jgi:N-acetylglucosamine kinase-like BadF-type ATPase
VLVKNDSFGGLRAGTDKPYGMVIAAGTGLNAAVITPTGEEWAYGYYETFGGAGTIAEDTYAAVLRAADGRGMPTLLTDRVLKKLGFATVEMMLRAHIARQISYRQFYSLVPVVFEAALEGDAEAARILVRQGEGLAEYVTAMARRFHMTNLTFDVVLAGSIFKGVGPLLIDTITQVIHQTAPKANIVRARYEPVVGSMLLAYDALGIQVTEAMYANLAASAPGSNFFDTTTGTGLTPVYRDENNELDSP